MKRMFRQGKMVLSLVVTMMLVAGLFSATAMAADKPQDKEENTDYYSVLNDIEKKQSCSIENDEMLNNKASNEEPNIIKEDIYETNDSKRFSLSKDYYETEGNDGFSTADVINSSYAGFPNYNLYGQINDDYQDLDMYQMTVSMSGYLTLYGMWYGDHTMQRLETELLIGVYNSAKRLIDVATIQSYDEGSFTELVLDTYLAEGTYYIVVLQDDTYPSMFVGEEYRIDMYYSSAYPSVNYQTNVQNIGWQDWCSNGGTAGTSGQSLRLEALRITIGDNWLENSGIEYQTHVQNIGWMDWVSDGDISGITGKSLRLEAIRIRLYGEYAQDYDIYYRVHAQNVGWMGWAKNGQAAGTAGYSYRLEAIEIKMVEKGAGAPGSTAKPFINANSDEPQVNVPSTQHSVRYQTHVQNVGWQGWKRNGEMAGTSGQSLRLEGMYIEVEGVKNAIEYRTHVQNIGWQDWVRDGAMTGTSGQSLRLEAIDIRLTGDMASRYDIYYRVHAQNVGWMGWAKNGESAGTAGFSYRLEGIQVVLVDKGGAAPGSTANAFIQN